MIEVSRAAPSSWQRFRGNHNDFGGFNRMSRGVVIFCFWVLGFSIGFVGYLVLPGIAELLGEAAQTIFDHKTTGALIAGIAGSAISTLTIVSWANRSSTRF